MKEFIAETGGRYIYNDDLINLQDLGLSITHLFDGCENFIISGCEVVGPRISSGYVYLNGKICVFNETLADSFPAYIAPKNSVKNVGYMDYGDKPGVHCYECQLVYTPAADGIAVASDGSAMRLEDGFFNRYSLTLNAKTPQTVKQEVIFERNVTAGSLSTGVISGGQDGILNIEAPIVKIPGTLMLNGHNVNEYFVPMELYKGEMFQCVKKTDSIQVFVDQAGGGSKGQKKVCEIIGAADLETVSESFRTILQDIVDLSVDTGWIDLIGENIKGQARQVRNVVCIRGTATPGVEDFSGEPAQCPFTLPKEITPPKYQVIQYLGSSGHELVISGSTTTPGDDGSTYAISGSTFNVTYIV